MKPNFPLIIISLLILASCGTTSTTSTNQVKQMSKDKYFAQQCFQRVKSEVFDYDGLNQKEFRNCKVDPSYSYSNLTSRPSEFSQRPDICDKDSMYLSNTESLTKELWCNGGRFGKAYYSTYYNIVSISCAQPWGAIIKNTYKCYLTENGNVEHWENTQN